jgi:uncharacterized protein (DUF1015 family)
MEISPFRGIRYNQRMVGDLARIICPPYDVITPAQRRLYYEASDFNAIRLEFPETTGDRYQRAANTFQRWLEHAVLQYDNASSFYLHEHEFEYSGTKMLRRGVIARVQLGPWGSDICPHEETSSKAKGDRLQLMRACRANFSPLLALYQDSEQRIAPILFKASRAKPVLEITVPPPSTGAGEGAEAHMLWAITDPEIERELSELLSAQPIYIADGHHRYETALDYQRERKHEQSGSPDSSVIAGRAKQSLTGRGGFNYVMMELVDLSDPGLVVLPLHRLVRGIESSVLVGLRDRLRSFFALESVPSIASSFGVSVLPADSCLGILGLQPASLVVLKRRQDVELEAMMPGNKSQAYREFGVSILNHVILDKLLSGAKNVDVAYTVDVEEARQQIREGKYQLGFLLHPPQAQMVKAIADAQDRMPRKSTYFYPKLPAGLVINPLG